MSNLQLTEILKTIREEFHKELQTKTGWGRVEVGVAYDKAVAEALAKKLQEVLP